MIRSINNKSKLLKSRVNVKKDFPLKNRTRNYGNVTLSKVRSYVTSSFKKENWTLKFNGIRYYNTSSLLLGNPWDNVSKEVLAMPALSPTMNDGTIVSWLKKEGDSYTAGETLAEIETDKATVAFDATDDGIIAKILVPEGTKNVPVGAPIAISVSSPEDIPKVKDYDPSAETGQQPVAETTEETVEEAPSERPDVDFEEVAMPALSPTMNDGTIVSWLKKEGEKFTAGETLAEIETDKATVAFDATDDGILAKILVPEGTKNVPVGSPIALTVTREEDVSKVQGYTPSKKAAPKPSTPTTEKKEAPKPKEEPRQPQAPERTEGRVFATPYAKMLAREKGIDISEIRGTGPNARIIGADVLEYVPSRRVAEPTKAFIPTPETVIPTYTDIEVSNIRRVTAERLTFSKQNIPHYYLTIECNLNNLIEMREELNSLSKNEYKLSFNDFVIKAAAKALKAVPEVNSEWRGEVIRRYHNVDINVAVNTDAGLFTPLIQDADKKGLAEISNEVKSLAQKAKDGKISLDEMRTGTFTISNLGMLGITEFSAVINPPQACILAVGSVTDKVSVLPVEESSESGEQHYDVQVDKVMKVTLSCDHRVVDGAVGARWLQSFKDYMENPIKMIL